MTTNNPNCDYIASPINPEFEKEYTDGTHSALPIINLNYTFDTLWTHANVGHDLPIWFKANDGACAVVTSKKNKNVSCDMFEKIKEAYKTSFNDLTFKNDDFLKAKTVMFIGNEPMRTNHINNHCISLSSPWGIHSLTYRTSKLVWKLISYFNSNGSNVYVTDKYKLFVNKKGNLLSMDKTFLEPMIKCLCDEVKIVNPDIIVLIGDNVETYLFGYFLKSNCQSKPIKYFLIPHPRSGLWRKSEVVKL